MRCVALFLYILLLSTGCAYRFGANVTAGLMDEIQGKGESDGLESVADRVLERALLAELGHQLGEGLVSGAAEVTPEQQANLERIVEGLLDVAATRSSLGLRRDVSPALRATVQEGIIDALSQGMRGEVGDSLEETVERVIAQAFASLRRGIEDPSLQMALADLVREAIYSAMREGRPGTPGIGETLESTLTGNLLVPLEESVGGMTDTVAVKVEDSARRTENTLQAVISALVVILGVFVLMYTVSRRQLARQRDTVLVAKQEIATMGAAIDLLDHGTRETIQSKVQEYQRVTVPAASDAPAARSDSYERPDKKD